MSAAALTLDRLVRRFGSHNAVDTISLEVAPGELMVLLGPSGCGKTTTLRLVAGFITPDDGDIRLDGQSIVTLPPHKRDMGIVFQSYALFPHLSVARNIAFGLEMRRINAAATAARVEEMLRLIRLEALAARLPRQLSGGQQQRVALARALAIHPKLLLLDEPLSNLDAALRADMAREIRLLQQVRGITTIMVTHDQAEAMAMADRLVVMHDGRVEQIGAPEALHLHPATPFVARFIGGSNVIRGRIDAGSHLVLENGASVALVGRYHAAGSATLAVRPDSIRLGLAGAPRARVEGAVELCTWLGATVEHVVRIGPELTVLVRGPGLGPDAIQRHAAGTRVALDWAAEDEFLFDGDDRPLAATPTEPAATKEIHHA
ncbi:MAG TPA: ABC transporter ATP-binding protein [Acetobacteraceae bacterium]|nr:ABC transporter ATP-binding protein [Acetobacteraceae bacterium]